MPVKRVMRVLVTLDGPQPDERVLRTLWNLLDPDALELTGLYVEDEDLLRAANLPCLREVSFTGSEAGLDAARLAREMAEEAAAAERAFETLAAGLMREHRRLAHHFTITRGRFAQVFDTAAADADLVMVTRALHATGMRRRLGRSFGPLVRQPRHVLFVNEPWATGSSIVVLNCSDQALDYGSRLARAEGLRLVVVTPIAVAPPRAERLPPDTTVRQLADWDEEKIAELCLREDARLLVLPEIPDLDWQELLVSLMDRLPCSVLKLASDSVAEGKVSSG